MNKEKNIVLQIISDHLICNKTDSISIDNLEKITYYFQKQQLLPIFYFQCNSIFADEFSKRAYMSQIYYSVRREEIVKKLKRELVDVKYCFLKGVELASYYPVPALRSMGDIDMLIKSDDRLLIDKKIRSLGFELSSKSNTEWVYKCNDIILEVHSALLHDNKRKKGHLEFAAKVWDYVDDNNQLDWNYHFVFILLHLMNHLIAKGVGLRQFMDIAVCCQSLNLDWDWICQECKKIGLLQFLRNVLAFNKQAFNIESPIKVKELDNDFYEQVINQIFKGGVFGHSNKENRENGISGKMFHESLDKKEARKLYFISEAFPPYEIMCKLPYCRYIRGRKIILPIAWCHRFIYRVFNKKHRDYFVRRVFISTEKVDARNNILRKWGLY